MKNPKYLKGLFLLLLVPSFFQAHAISTAKVSKDLNLPDPPIIIWTNPTKEYTILKSNRAGIKATIKSKSGLSSVQIFLNDILYGEPEMSPSTTEAGGFIITKTIVFEPGDNSVYIVVTNNEGSVKSEKRFFTVAVLDKIDDPTAISATGPPVVIWTDPLKVKTSLNIPKASVKATIRSGSGISSVIIYLNGVVYGEPEMTPSATERGSFLIQKTINFEPGEDSIYLVATSPGGSVTSDKRYFSVQTAVKTFDANVPIPAGPPVITWTNPYRSRTTLNSTRTDISATIKSGSGISSVLLYLNDVLYGEPDMVHSTTEPGSFNISKTLNLQPGQDSIYFVASSGAGTTVSEKRYFIIPPTARVVDSAAINLVPPPSIAWTIPSVKSTTLRSASADVKATIKSASNLTSAVIYLNGMSQGEIEIKPSTTDAQSYLLEKTLNFRQVENNIFIEVHNSGGAVARSEPRIFICPPSSLAANKPVNQNVTKTGDTGLNQQPASKQAETTQVVPPSQPPAQAATSSAGPVITWTSPSGSHTTMDSFNATVKASIKSGSGLKSVMFYLNGISKGAADIKQTDEASGTYSVEKNITFGPGENNIYLVASNDAGASKSEVRYFSNPESVAPVITWTNPESPNTLVNEESLTISACIKSSTELRSVKLLVNGNIQIEDNVFPHSASADCNYNWNTSVVLREGDNSIFIIAANTAGSITSEKRVIKLTTAIAEKRLALVIGNSQYKNSAPLKNPVNDANLMEATLKDLGFEVIKRLDAGYDQMKSAIREFENKLPDYNIALFYYAGHGNQVDGKNYLIPTDARLEKPGDCKFEAIEVNLIVDEFERYQDNTNIVILDACRNNPFAAWARGGEAGFRPMNFTSGTIVAYATSMGATAADGKGANGLYTEELVKQMAVSQPISSVFMNTRVQVRKLSNNQQVPSEENKLNGEFYFKK